MKLKLFGGSSPIVQQVTLLAGGYDADSGKVTFVVRGEEDNQAGSMTMDLAEARRVLGMLEKLPSVERVGLVEKAAPTPLTKVGS